MMVEWIRYSSWIDKRKIERIEVETISEPSLENIWRVEQRSFAYLLKDSDKKLLETLSIADCIGVYVKNSSLSALLHADTSWSMSSGLRLSDQVNLFLDYLDKITKEYHSISRKAIVVTSNQALLENIDEVYLTLQKRCDKIEVVRRDEPLVNVIFNKDGNLYEVNPKTIKDYDSWFYRSLQNLNNDGLKCMNTGEIVRKPPIKV